MPEPLVTLDQPRSVRDIRAIARGLPYTLDHRPTTGPDRDMLAALAGSGLLPRLFPAAHGGSRSDGRVSAVELCELREGLACENPAAETTLALQGLGGYPILQSGAPEVAHRWVPQIAQGTAAAGFALSEPEAGSDAAAVACVAEEDADGYRLSGVKTWISNAPWADVYTLFARTTAEAGSRGVTAFVVPGDAPGLSGSPLELLAPHVIGTLELDGVHVPASSVLGNVDAGFRVAMRTLDLFRPSVGAFAVGMGQAALEMAAAHARERHAFGQPIKAFQAVSHPIADTAMEIHAARLLVAAAAQAYDDGREADITRLAAMSKVFATETAQRAVDRAVQILGARGLQIGHPLELLYREVRATRIYEGTSEIQRNIIARGLLGR